MNPNGRQCPVVAEYDVGPGEVREFGELLGMNAGRPWRNIQPKAFRLELRKAWRRLAWELPNLAIHYAGIPGAAIAPTRETVGAWLADLHDQELGRLLARSEKLAERAEEQLRQIAALDASLCRSPLWPHRARPSEPTPTSQGARGQQPA